MFTLPEEATQLRSDISEKIVPQKAKDENYLMSTDIVSLASVINVLA